MPLGAVEVSRYKCNRICASEAKDFVEFLRTMLRDGPRKLHS